MPYPPTEIISVVLQDRLSPAYLSTVNFVRDCISFWRNHIEDWQVGNACLKRTLDVRNARTTTSSATRGFTERFQGKSVQASKLDESSKWDITTNTPVDRQLNYSRSIFSGPTISVRRFWRIPSLCWSTPRLPVWNVVRSRLRTHRADRRRCPRRRRHRGIWRGTIPAR